MSRSEPALKSVIPGLYGHLGVVERTLANQYFESRIRALRDAPDSQRDPAAVRPVARTAVNFGIRCAVLPLGLLVGAAIVLLMATTAREPWLVIALAVLTVCALRYAKAFADLRRCYRYFTQDQDRI